MMLANLGSRTKSILLAGSLASSILSPLSWAQEYTNQKMSDHGPFSAASKVSSTQANTAPTSGNWDAREGMFYQRNWGVDIAGVRRVSSGYMLEFRYRVVDADKAKVLNAETVKPYLIDEATGAVLAVPAMENIGELRQSVVPDNGRIYFIIFGNPGKLVKPGNRVSIVIGKFRVDGLVVN